MADLTLEQRLAHHICDVANTAAPREERLERIERMLNESIPPELMRLRAELAAARERLEAAEAYIAESPCDPDIYPEQWAAYQRWQRLAAPTSAAHTGEGGEHGTD